MRINEVTDNETDFFTKLKGEDLSFEKVEDIVKNLIVDNKTKDLVLKDNLRSFFIKLRNHLENYLKNLNVSHYEGTQKDNRAYSCILNFTDKSQTGIICVLVDNRALHRGVKDKIMMSFEIYKGGSLTSISYDIVLVDYIVQFNKQDKTGKFNLLNHKVII